MYNDKVKAELPPNLEELKKAAYRTASWRDRLKAVDELGQWNSPETIAILKRILDGDSVYRVQEAAYNKLEQFGESVPQPSRKKGELFRDISKILLRIKKSLPEDHTFEEFKEKLQKMRIDVYDSYEGDKGADFDQWLEGMWASVSPK